MKLKLFKKRKGKGYDPGITQEPIKIIMNKPSKHGIESQLLTFRDALLVSRTIENFGLLS